MSLYDEWSLMTEEQMRATAAPTPKTVDELAALATVLSERQHDYGTCCHAMSVLATAAYNFVASHLGVTGFQASLADLDILRRTRGMERFQVRDIGDLLYPQYLYKWTGAEEAIKENADWLRAQAADRLATSRSADPEVVAHWKRLAALPPSEVSR